MKKSLFTRLCKQQPMACRAAFGTRHGIVVLFVAACFLGGCESVPDQPAAEGAEAASFELADGTPVVIESPHQFTHQEIAAALEAILRAGELKNVEGLTIERTASGTTLITFERFTAPDGTYIEDGRIEIETMPNRDQ